MRILIINDYASLEGGAEVQIVRLRRLLKDKGIDARIFSTDITNHLVKNEADYKCVGTKSRLRILLQTLNPFAYFKLRKVLREFKPDVVYVKLFLTQLSPLILPLLKDIPSIYHVAWYRPVCPTGTKLLPDGSVCNVRAGTVCYQNGCLSILDWALLMFQLKLFGRWKSVFDMTLVNSESLKNILKSNGINHVEVLYYGIPSIQMNPFLSDTPSAAFVGRLVREKGADVLVRAFANVVKQFPKAQLLVAGDGKAAINIKALISELNISSNVKMLGHISNSDINSSLGKAWVQIVPSIWMEPFGIAAAEAMSRGTAVIASDTGGLKEIIENGVNGFLVPPGDIDAITEKLIEIFKNRSLVESLGKAGRDSVVSRFSEDEFLKNLLKICKTLHAKYV